MELTDEQLIELLVAHGLEAKEAVIRSIGRRFSKRPNEVFKSKDLAIWAYSWADNIRREMEKEC